MSFVDENANLGLFVIIAVVAAVMVILSVFYQDNFQEINARYNTKLNELNNTFHSLIGARAELNQTAEKLLIKSKREEDLSNKFTSIKEERDALQSERDELSSTVKEQVQTINALNSTVTTLRSEAKSKQEKVESLEKIVDSLQDKIDCLKAGNANC